MSSRREFVGCRRLSAALGLEHGIRRFWSLIDVRNENMRRMLAELGYEVRYSLRDGLFHTEILV